MDAVSSIFNKQVELTLWKDIPAGTWLRKHGRTKVVVIDDDVFDHDHFFGRGSPIVAQEFEERLNMDVSFFQMPGCASAGASAEVTFSDHWFKAELARSVSTGPPIAAFVLDLKFGSDRPFATEPTGVHFLNILRSTDELALIPVVIASSLPAGSALLMALKNQGSFQDYVEKSDTANLSESIFEAVVRWGLPSDPTLGAFSQSMRTVARRLRQIAIGDSRVAYEVGHQNGATFPKPVLFTGELGSGKNFLASRLHRMSVRRGFTFDTFTFSGASGGEDTANKLFGIGLHSATGRSSYLVHAPTGLRLDRDYGLERGCVRLTEIGVLQKAHAGDRVFTLQQATMEEPNPGTVLIDELSEAPDEYQGKLLEVLNEGRFRPHLTGTLIPSERRLDVWLMFACSAHGYARVRDDLKSRLSRYDWISVPELGERAEDIVPLAMRVVAYHRSELPLSRLPHEVFTGDALDHLARIGRRISVRQLEGMIGGLTRVSSKIPFNASELETAAMSSRIAWADEKPSVKESPAPDSTPLRLDELIERWANSSLDSLVLPGYPLARARSAAATLLLAQLHRVLREELIGPLATIEVLPGAGIWRRLTGEDLATNIVISRLADILMLDEETTIRIASDSEYIRWLLLSPKMAARSTAVRSLSALFRSLHME